MEVVLKALCSVRGQFLSTHGIYTNDALDWLHIIDLYQDMLNLAVKYNKAVQEEDELPPEKLAIANVGRQDAKKHLEEHISNLMSSNIVQTLGMMLDTVVF